MTFQIGDRVTLLATTAWVISNNNPAEESEWFCEGTVTSADPAGGLGVLWDNYSTNSYNSRDGDIQLVSEDILV